MNTLLKALLISFLIIVLIIALPILVTIVGLAWPVILGLMLIIFIPAIVGIMIGKNSKDE